MPNHHLLSFLGASRYQPCTYTSEDDFGILSAYSSVAVAELIRQRFTAAETDNEDNIRATVFVTPTARIRNAEPLKSVWPGGIDLDFAEIPEKGDEASYWTIFTAINHTVRDHDTVWLDITHSFRYLPMLAYAVLQYLQDVRGVAIGGIYYGAAETMGPIQDWPEDPEQRKVPLHDLSAFLQVNRWAGALRSFHDSGSATQIRRLTDSKALPLIKQSKGQDSQAKALKQLGIALETWSQQINTCRGSGLLESTIGERINEFIEAIGNEMVPPLAHEFDRLRDQFDSVRKGHVQNIFIAAEWCVAKGLTQQTWTLLQEGIITYHAELWGDALTVAFPVQTNGKASPEKLKRNFIERRNFVAQLFKVSAFKIPTRKWQEPIGKFPTLGEELQQQIPAGLPELFADITADRNDINHAGFDQHAADHIKIAKRAQMKLMEIRKRLPEAF